jgi:hypothetical protein
MSRRPVRHGSRRCLGVSLLLSSAAPYDASKDPSNSLPLATRGVSERLDAPREAVSELDPPTIGPISGITGGPAVAPNAVKADNVFGE